MSKMSKEDLDKFHQSHIEIGKDEPICMVCEAYQWGKEDMRKRMKHQLKTANRHLRYAQETIKDIYAFYSNLHKEAKEIVTEYEKT